MLPVYVKVPYATFRIPQIRSCFSSYSVPPPATAYGFFLSMVGEFDREKHVGCGISIIMVSKPKSFSSIRKIFMKKDAKAFNNDQFSSQNSRPKTVQSLTGVEVLFFLHNGNDKNRIEDRVKKALEDPNCPDRINRTGILSLGESGNIVETVKIIENSRLESFIKSRKVVSSVVPSSAGVLVLPVWANYDNPAKAKYATFQIKSGFHEFAPTVIEP